MRRGNERRWLLALLLLSCASCIESPDFDDPEIVNRPRVLALLAEPPEIAPGEPVTLSLLVAGAERFEASFRACGTSDAFSGGSQYGAEAPDEGCGGPLGVDLGKGERAVVPGALTQGFFENLELAAMTLGAALPEGAIDKIRTSVGLPFLVEATVVADGRTIRAVKRVLVSERATPNTNPPPPQFLLADSELRGDVSDGVCRTADGRAPFVRAGRDVELAPVTLDDEEAWLEPYEVLDARGELVQREERAFYSWFSTGGRFDQGVSHSPLRNELWTTPAAVGCYPLWLVVRDGHGGTSSAART